MSTVPSPSTSQALMVSTLPVVSMMCFFHFQFLPGFSSHHKLLLNQSPLITSILPSPFTSIGIVAKSSQYSPVGPVRFTLPIKCRVINCGPSYQDAPETISNLPSL